MSDQQDHDEDDFDDHLDTGQDEGGDDEGENTAPPEGGDDGQEEDDEVDIGFDGEEVEEVNPLRQLREENKRLKAEARSRPAAPEPEIVVGEKPTLESSGYDEEKFETDLDAWKDRKRQADEQASRANAGATEVVDIITADTKAGLDRFVAAKKALKVPNFDIAQSAVETSLSDNQLRCLFQAVEGDPAKLIYALGRTPAKLAELAAIKNPVKFTAAIARLEGKVTVKSRRQSVDPDEPVRGSAPKGMNEDKREKELEAKAAKSGNRTELLAYRREKKARLAAKK